MSAVMMKRPGCRWLRRIAPIVLGMIAGSAHAQNPVDGYAPVVAGDIRAIVAQTDGHALVGGLFSAVGGQPCASLCRLRVDGRIAEGFPSLGVDGVVHAMRAQADGKVIVGGDFDTILGVARAGLARLNADGTLDTSFNAAVSGGIVAAIAVQPDGKILIGGTFNSVGAFTRPKLARLFADGRADPGFAVTGTGTVNAIVELTGGRIVVGGQFSNFGGGGGNNLVRLLADGTLNSGADLAANGPVFALAREADGRIVVGGDFTTIGAQARSRLARLLVDGGIALSAMPAANDTVRSLLVLDNGDVVVGGDFTSIGILGRSRLALLQRGGGLLVSYAPVVDNGVRALAVQPDGQLLVGGLFQDVDGSERRGLARLHPGGDLDTSLVFLPFRGGSNVISMATRADDKVLIGGSSLLIEDQDYRSGVARLRTDGRLDTSFANLQGASNLIRSLSALPDNLTLAGGRARPIAPVLLRLANDGNGGQLGGPMSGFEVSVALAQDDGRVLLAGSFDQIAGIGRDGIARLLPDGSVDAAFAPSITGGDDGVLSAASDPAGSVLIVGDFTAVNGVSRATLARVFPNGTLDTGFAPVTGGGSVSSLLRQPDGAIVIAGGFTTVGGVAQPFLARLREDGSRDASFAPDIDDAVDSMTLQADGKLIVTGDFTSVDGIAQPRIARLHSNGRRDDGFEPVALSADDSINAVILQRDGKVLIAGSFESISGQQPSRFARLSTGAPALESLRAEGTSLIWLRSGAAPELSLPPIVEISPDGNSYSGRFQMRRVAGGWRVDGLPIDVGQQVYLRISGESAGGYGAASRSRIERVLRYVLTDRIFRHGFD